MDTGWSVTPTLPDVWFQQWQRESLSTLCRGATAHWSLLPPVQPAPVPSGRSLLWPLPEKITALGFCGLSPGLRISSKPGSVPLQVWPKSGLRAGAGSRVGSFSQSPLRINTGLYSAGPVAPFSPVFAYFQPIGTTGEAGWKKYEYSCR
jgi:hypothetical protein